MSRRGGVRTYEMLHNVEMLRRFSGPPNLVLFGKISIVNFSHRSGKNIIKHEPSLEGTFAGGGNFYTFSTYIVVFTAKNDAFLRDL